MNTESRLQQIFHDQLLGGKNISRYTIESTIESFLKQEGLPFSKTIRDELVEKFVTELLTLEPLEALLQDPQVLEIMINRYDEVYVERRGQLEETGVKFNSEEHLRHFINQICESTGRKVDENSPMMDLRLADGSRMNVVLPPVAVRGAAVTIRRIPKNQPSVEQLIEWGCATREMFDYLRDAVRSLRSILVAGGTGSGKTTILNKLIEFVPDSERIVTVESGGDLILREKNTVRLDTRPADIHGKGEVSLRDLVVNATKMRPERIILSEARRAEFLNYLEALNTGHDGSMFSVHANSPRDALSRLEVMALMSGFDVPVLNIREQLASGIHVIVHQQRLQDGSRKIMGIYEVTGMKGSAVELQPVFEYENGQFVRR